MDNIKLKIENITKSYSVSNEASLALDNVSFEVKSGEFLSVLGPSGCGKTTLLRIISGLLAPDSGRIYLDGNDITGAPPNKRSLGIVFQNYALFENMTVFDNVAYAATLKAKREKNMSLADVKKQTYDILEKLGISELEKKHPASLSGGQMQRVAIARTLILNPDIMLFDEPMSALDIATRLQLRAVIKDIQKNYSTTMIYITHDQEEAFAMSDRVLVMQKAKISQLDTPKNIIASPANEYVKSFVVDNLMVKMDWLSKFLGE